jgi:LEA14-like dessication related protein
MRGNLKASPRYSQLGSRAESYKRGPAIRVAAATAMLALLFLSSCLGRLIEQPTFTLKEISIQQAGLKELNLLLGIEVRNPNPYGLEMKSLDFKFYLDDREIGKGELTQEILIPKDCTSDIRVPITASYTLLGDYLRAVLSGREIRYRLAGEVKIKAGPCSATVPFTKQGVLNSQTK